MIDAVRGFTENEIRERLGITTWLVRGNLAFEPEEFRRIPEAGIAVIEIAQNRDQYQEEDPASMLPVTRAIRGAGLEVAAFHARGVHFGEGSLAECNNEIERVTRMVDHLLALGGKVFGTHAKMTDPCTRRGYETLARYFAGMPVKFAVENRANDGQPAWKLVEFVDSLGLDNVGILLDVGHERDDDGRNPFTVPGRAGEVVRMIGHRLVHVHLHDLRGDVKHLPPFEGDVRWGEIFAALKEIQYGGAFVFEVGQAYFRSDALRKIGEAPARLAELSQNEDTPA